MDTHLHLGWLQDEYQFSANFNFWLKNSFKNMASHFLGSCLAPIVHDSGRKGLYVTNTISWSVGKPRSWTAGEKLPALPLQCYVRGWNLFGMNSSVCVSHPAVCIPYDALHSTMENCSILYSLTFHPPAYSALGKQFRSSGMQVGSHFLRWTKQKNCERFTLGCSGWKKITARTNTRTCSYWK